MVLPPSGLIRPSTIHVPKPIADAGDNARERYFEFFTANIRNPNTRRAYLIAVNGFLGWCELNGLSLPSLRPTIVATYIEGLMRKLSPPTVKQHLAALRMFCDYLVIGQVLPTNPCHAVRGPKHVVKKGKTPVLSAKQARDLLDSIKVSYTHPLSGVATPNMMGLRDRALIATMIFTFARIGAVTAMNVEDYWQNGKRWWIRLHEKGGKHHEVPAHHTLEVYLDEYILHAGIGHQGKMPLFRSIPGHPQALTERRLSSRDALAMVKRRSAGSGLPNTTCNHSFRATGITAYLSSPGSTLERAMMIAAHESPRTTKLYDRRSDGITLDEIERITI